MRDNSTASRAASQEKCTCTRVALPFKLPVEGDWLLDLGAAPLDAGALGKKHEDVVTGVDSPVQVEAILVEVLGP